MIPKHMEAFLRERLPAGTWENRLVRENGLCFMDFGPSDVDRLLRLGIQGDSLGPRLVACMWDESTTLEVGGYLVVDNLAMGRPSMGGVRMVPELTPAEIAHLARGMTLKNAAADLPYGGGKSGIVTCPDLTPEEHTEVVRRFARLLFRYRDIYLPGPDVGTNDPDMRTIAIENGLDSALSKPPEMGGNLLDTLGAAGGGLAIALEALLEEMPRLAVLPQFADLQIPSADELTVLIQGFGAVGANAARSITERLPGARITGMSDTSGYLFNAAGLPVPELLELRQGSNPVAKTYYQKTARKANPHITRPALKFSNAPDDLLRESAFCLIPASPIANYLDMDEGSHPCVTVDHMGYWAVIIEGANTYSPAPEERAARSRLERVLYREMGLLIAADYLVNSGGVIYAAQEHLIKTPQNLRIPERMLGDRQAVEKWIADHASKLEELAAKRRQVAEAAREQIIRRNMRELVDLLVADPDLLPGEAAEHISIRRIATRESDRTAAEIMESIITIPVNSSVREAAKLLVEAGSPIMAVVNAEGSLVGVVTDWDITRAMAQGLAADVRLERVMTRKVIAAALTDTVLELVRKLEYHEISAMPVVDKGKVRGMITTDQLSRRTLLRLLQSQIIA